MQLIVASVPLLHMRTISTEGTFSTKNSAIGTSYGFGVPKLVPLSQCLAHCIVDFGMIVPLDHRPPRADEIDQVLPVHRGKCGTGRALGEEGRATDTAECPHR